MVIATDASSEVFRLHMLVAQSGLQLQTAQFLAHFHKRGDVTLMLLVVAVGDVALCILETAFPSGVGVFLTHFNPSFPQRVCHEELLGYQPASCQGIGVHISVFMRIAQFLLPVAVALVAVGVVGVEVDVELACFSRVVEAHLMLRSALGPIGAAVLQVVVQVAIGQQVVVIVADGLHIVIGALVEPTEGVVVVQLIVESPASFKEGIAGYILLPVADCPQRVGIDRLFELATAPVLVVRAKQVGK